MMRLKSWILLGFIVLFSGVLQAKVIDPVRFRLEIQPYTPKTQYVDVHWIFEIDPGWKIQHPKDKNPLGIPPQVQTNDSKNIAKVQILWPENVQDFVHNDRVRLRVYPKDSEQPMILNMDVQFSICNVECRFFQDRLTLKMDSMEQMQHTKRDKTAINVTGISWSMLWMASLLAFVGGFILNMMPCVLPVLSLKLMQFTRKETIASKLTLSAQTWATILGIYTSFIVLALVAIGLRHFGMAVGWGFHFQQPGFVLFMCVLMVLFALNLLGLFEFELPQWIQNRIHIRKKGWLSHFALGLLATLLATPCTAPFLGAAVTLALSSTYGTMLWIFMWMATGFALPYFIVLIRPQLIQRIPKPGNWMVWVRRILGLGLLGTSVWLALIWYQMQYISQETQQEQSLEEGWESFDVSKIESYLKKGFHVFVDVTAKWCVTCAANKQFVLGTSKIQSLLGQAHIKKLRADWTMPSDVISKYLNEHQRYGIPFNAYYSPKCPRGYVFSEILKTSELEQVITQKC